MHHSVHRTTVALAAAFALFTVSQAPGQAIDLSDAAARTFGLEAATVLDLQLDRTPGRPLIAAVSIDGVELTLALQPHSVRAEGFQVWHQVDGGQLIPVDAGPVRTLSGSVLEVPGSRASGAMLRDGMHVTVDLPGAGRYWIEPIGGRVPGAAETSYLLYHQDQVIPSNRPCGTANAGGDGAAGAPLALDADMVELSGLTGTAPARATEAPAPPDGGIAGGTTYCTELACDADYPYYQDWGLDTEDRIQLIINTVNQQYQSQVDIQHYITAIIVRTSDEADPYSSSSPETLLGQFRTYWLQNHASIPRDVAHLFTGRELAGGVIGIAYTIGGICTNEAYCLSQSDCCGSFACATDLTAHELGHLWGAFHCTCTGYTMNPFITCANQFNTGSINSIVNHRNSRTCLDEGGCPDYDECPTAATAGAGSNPFDTSDASTSGPAEPSCGGTITSDVWFRYEPTCDGPHILSLCSSGFDTTLAVYEGGCPSGSGQAIACNNDFCGNRSRIQLDLVGGTEYYLRIGSMAGQEGPGNLAISFVCQAPCPSDLNDDGETDVQDLTALILAWDTADPIADLSGDGIVGVEDLTSLILAWGPC